MGDVSRRYLLAERLTRDPLVAAAEALLAKATNKRECAEEALAAAKKPKKPKKDSEVRTPVIIIYIYIYIIYIYTQVQKSPYRDTPPSTLAALSPL